MTDARGGTCPCFGTSAPKLRCPRGAIVDTVGKSQHQPPTYRQPFPSSLTR
ncbi:hypothetical protein Cadr_000001819 [Camelus dromedarius]|uniref:Uncharacterized protein n=1 Tax=Camelus dromedarius TaxID=9838 RepID=A0A5N4EIY8_CAMDR|nr:hypothetical protein Cadr_000001819 [Camelus dromedarius]